MSFARTRASRDIRAARRGAAPAHRAPLHRHTVGRAHFWTSAFWTSALAIAPQRRDDPASSVSHKAISMAEASYQPRDWSSQSPFISPGYKSTALRGPTRPLVPLRQTLSEISGPAFGAEAVMPLDTDLTRNGRAGGEPQGERIIVTGRVLDENGRPRANTLIEIWQCNAAGRYIHQGRPARRAARPELLRRRPLRHRQRGPLPLSHRQARRLSVGQSPQCLAAGAHPLLAVRAELR